MKGHPSSHGLWEQSASPAPQTSPLVGSVSARVAVIGAGYTGLSAALHLRELGIEVLVLEAEEIGFGASGRNVGLVNAGLWLSPREVMDRLGEPHGMRLVRQLGEAPALVFELIERYGIECECVRNGTLHCAVGESGFRAIAERARQWHALGAPVELLSRAATARQVGCSAYGGSLLDRRAGVIQPLSYARGLARAALGRGARIFTGSPVTQVRDGRGEWLLGTDQGSVRAEWVIIASNAYSSAACKWLRNEFVALPYFNIATRPLSAGERAGILRDDQGIWDTERVLSSLRADSAGRLIFGSVGALRGSGGTIHRGWARRALAKLFPSLRSVELEHEWYGRIGMTADAMPRFHQIAPRMMSIGGYNGRGIAPGTSFGSDLARIVAGAISPDDLALPAVPARPIPLRALRALIYERGSQLVHLFGARG